MFIIRITLALALLSHFATACFAQSVASQTINITEGNAIKLAAVTDNASSYEWRKNLVPIPGAVTKILTVTTAGKYDVIAFNAEGCPSEPSKPVEVIVIPPTTAVNADMAITKKNDNKPSGVNDLFEYQINVKNNGPSRATIVEVKDHLPLNLTFEQLVNPLVGTASYNGATRLVTWNIAKLDSGEAAGLVIKVKASKYGIYKNTTTVTATEPDPDLTNNTATDIKYVYGITIPNVFTPNGDGKNDAFEIIGLPLYSDNEITIVNRWGSPVYQKKNYQNDWTANGLSDGTYFYVLKIKNVSNEWQEFKGYVTVLH